MKQSIFLVDAFAEKPFEGNPAAVCIMEQAPRDDWMQRVAMEMNQAETAYVWPEGNCWRLRWFAPQVEIQLCGHATLGSAHILWEMGYLKEGEAARFMTHSGELVCAKAGQKIEMDFPSVAATPCSPPSGLLDAIGAEAHYVGSNGTNFLIEVSDEQTLRGIEPIFSAIELLDCLGVIVTSLSQDVEFDFVSRYFAPKAGVPEDSATGSSHCCLAPYWAEKLGKESMLGYQASKRGAKIGTRVAGDRVFLSGSAVTTLTGTLLTEY